jgi:uncharacterized integral membrane protein
MTSQPPYEGDRGQAPPVPDQGIAPVNVPPARAAGEEPGAVRPGDSVARPEEPAGQRPGQPAAKRSEDSAIRRSRISGTWVAIIVAAILMIFLLVFILQNLTSVTVSFLGFEGNLPLGVALLFAAISGALLVALVGGARIVQIRRRVRRAGSPKPPPGVGTAH